MSMQQRSTVVSLVSALLILGYFGLRVFQMVQTATFTPPNVFQLWGIIIVATIVMVIVGTIGATILSAIAHGVRTGEVPPEQEYVTEDERDKIIALKGTRVSYVVASFGTAFAMLAFVLNQPALVMFTALIGSGIVAQIVGDIYRLVRYSRGA